MHKHKYFREQDYQNKLRTKIKSPYFLYYVHIDGEWRWIKDVPRNLRIRKYLRHVSARRQGYYKKYSNAVVRRAKGAYQYGAYRKLFDYWWTID